MTSRGRVLSAQPSCHGRDEVAPRKETHRDAFILKGAMLLELWMGRAHRTRKDLDLLGCGSPEIPHLETIFRELCLLTVDPDGLVFSPESVKGMEIREDNLYQGARISIQVDIGFGDAVFPGPEVVEYPSLLGFPHPRVGKRRHPSIERPSTGMVGQSGKVLGT